MSDDAQPPKNSRTIILVVVAILIGALILLFAMEWGSIMGKKPEEPAKPGASIAPQSAPQTAAVVPAGSTKEIKVEPGPTAVRAFGSGPAAPPEPIEGFRSELADGLNTPESDVRKDLQIVHDLFTHYLGELRELPVGNNAEITAALAGDNPRAYAILPPDHRAITKQGELVDRWGTPFFFHQLASDLMEIRSAGPDRRRYTADDAVWPAETATAETTVASDTSL